MCVYAQYKSYFDQKCWSPTFQMAIKMYWFAYFLSSICYLCAVINFGKNDDQTHDFVTKLTFFQVKFVKIY